MTSNDVEPDSPSPVTSPGAASSEPRRAIGLRAAKPPPFQVMAPKCQSATSPSSLVKVTSKLADAPGASRRDVGDTATPKPSGSSTSARRTSRRPDTLVTVRVTVLWKATSESAIEARFSPVASSAAPWSATKSQVPGVQ